MIKNWLFLALYLLFAATIEARYKRMYWSEMNNWDKCSTQCDEGVQYKSLVCVGEDFLKHKFPVATKLCDRVPLPENRTSRVCNYGYCSYKYVWKIVQEGHCSQTCGNSGFKIREMGCFYLRTGHTNSEALPTSLYYCAQHMRPDVRVPCNRFDCPAEFKESKWGECSKTKSTDECGPGVQKRPTVCIIRHSDGVVKEVNQRECLMTQMRIPKDKRKKISFWRYCFDHVNTAECLKKNRLPAKIHHDPNTLMQMTEMKQLVAQIGQTVYVIPWTTVVIKCPVDYFLKKNLIWSHKGRNYTFVKKVEFKSRNKLDRRIKVTKNGEIKILQVQTGDQGEWYCAAGEIKASTNIRLRSPSDGYTDFMARNTFWNSEMFNEEGTGDAESKEIIQWIASSWTPCTTTCGDDGVQTRKVTCERVKSKFYSILDPDVCVGKSLSKPQSKRKCFTGIECPTWQLRIENKDVCTDTCLDVNKGIIQASLNCSSNVLNYEYENCDPNNKPDIQCDNPNCQIKWNLSDWSRCSTTCGKSGFQARHMSCVWTTDLSSAGSLCSQEGLPIPQLIRECNPPSCGRSRCVDLKPYCPDLKQLCHYSVYRLQCCQTCSTALQI